MSSYAIHYTMELDGKVVIQAASLCEAGALFRALPDKTLVENTDLAYNCTRITQTDKLTTPALTQLAEAAE